VTFWDERVEVNLRAYDLRLLRNTRTHQFMHPVGQVVMAQLSAGLTLEFLREHAAVPWQMFSCLVDDGAGEYHLPDKPWLPLSYSLPAQRPLSSE
jgi:hypothetical protein